MIKVTRLQTFAISLLFTVSSRLMADFKSDQLKASRVRAAYSAKLESIESKFKAKHIEWPSNKIFWRAFKNDQVVELWAMDANNKYQLIEKYPVCSASGNLGPKRQQGDYQVPEGFYEFSVFNPFSNFHLSLKINYPNLSDRKLSPYKNLGGDVFMHGNCVSAGCIAMTDDLIQEIYVINVEARNHGQKRIPIHIFPTYLTEGSFNELTSKSTTSYLWKFVQTFKGKKATDPEELKRFWSNLKEGYDHFEKYRQLPDITVGVDGRYKIANSP